jgi:hypothetical protein
LEKKMSFLPLSPGGHRFGLFHDNPYHPAKKLLRLNAPTNLVLPPKATTSQWAGKIRDQGQEGSCTGQLKAEYRDWMYRKLFMWEKNQTVAVADFMASADFAYLTNLIADGDLGTDAGSSIHQTFVTLNQLGCCLESQQPYNDSDYSTTPTPEQYAEALAYKGGPYHSLPTIQEVKMSIASGYAVGIGINVYDSFEGDQLTNTGFMPMPTTSENLLGGHAQLVLDYDDTIAFPDGTVGGVLVQNSWGESWGLSLDGRTDRGCYWMPYAFFAYNDPSGNGLGVSDMWMMHEGKAW